MGRFFEGMFSLFKPQLRPTRGRTILFAVGVVCWLIAGEMQSTSDTRSDASSIDGFLRMQKVYVPVQMSGIYEDAAKAVLSKGYGNVMASDLSPHYTYRTLRMRGQDLKALEAHANLMGLPSGTSYREMTLQQFTRAALADSSAQAVSINNGELKLTKDSLQAVLTYLNNQRGGQEDLPFTVYTLTRRHSTS